MSGISLLSAYNPLAAISSANFWIAFNNVTDSVEHLSSGLRVVNAADDPAGMAVAEMLRSDIAVLGQGMRNLADAISMTQTAPPSPLGAP